LPRQVPGEVKSELPLTSTFAQAPPAAAHAPKQAKETKRLPRQVPGEVKSELPPTSTLAPRSLAPSTQPVAPAQFVKGPRLHIPHGDLQAGDSSGEASTEQPALVVCD
jgi:hypothetical protein